MLRPNKSSYSIHAPTISASGGSSNVPTNVTFQGGQVINNPQFYNVYIGDWSSAANQARAAIFNKFIQDLVGSSWMTLFTEYGITNPGAFAKQINVPNPSVTSAKETNSDVENIIQNAINSNIIPEPSNQANNQVFILYLPDGVGISDAAGLGISMCIPGANSFGYHYYFITKNGNQCYYMVIPGLDDACLQQTCASDASCSLKLTQSQQDRQTQVISHEIAELLTNPEGNSGWFDKASGEEIGDICNGEPVTLTVGNNNWSVQKIYAKGLGACALSASSVGPLAGGGGFAGLDFTQLGPQLKSVLTNPLALVGIGTFMYAIYLIAQGQRRALGIMLLVGLFGGFYFTGTIQSLTTTKK